MDDAMRAEFDTVAGWTADVALELGQRYHIPAACRGSGSPAALEHLIDELRITDSDRMLDCGAGVGGPAAFVADRIGVRPVLTDPEFGACRGARRLFHLPVVQAASELPLRPASFDVAWSLGVLCTVPDQGALLAELRRVLTDAGRLGLLVFVRTAATLTDPPRGNNFPTAERLRSLLAAAGWQIHSERSTADMAASTQQWQGLADAVDAELERRHAEDPLWQTAAAQSEAIGRLLAAGEVTGTLLVATPG